MDNRDPAGFHPDPELPHPWLSQRIDRAMMAINRWSSWVWLALLATIVVNVILRYLFAEGRIEFEEIQWHLCSIGFLLAIATGVSNDSHIRVDILHERLSRSQRAWVEVYGLILLFFPFCVLVLIYAGPFVAASYSAGEVSPAPGGLGGRWLIKAMLPLAFGLLLVAGIARLLRVLTLLFRPPGTHR